MTEQETRKEIKTVYHNVRPAAFHRNSGEVIYVSKHLSYSFRALLFKLLVCNKRCASA